MGDKIKKRDAQQKKINIPTENNSKINYPTFCFKHLQTVPQRDYKFYADFIQRLKKLSSLTWNEINVSNKHGFGTEKMPIAQIKPSLPKFITPDIESLIVFRANGDNRPFLGLRTGNIFHIIFIEENFGDVYNH